MSYLTVQALTLDRVAEAFPIASLGVSGLTPELWQDFASQRISQSEPFEGGILTVRDGCNSIIGLASYLLKANLDSAPALLVDHIIAIAIFEKQRRQAQQVLLDAVYGVAREHRCGSVDIHLQNRSAAQADRELLGLLRRAGHRETGVTLTKALRTGT